MKKLAVFDVDGVVLKGQFLLAAARRVGPLHYIRSLLLCFFYEIGVLRLRSLIERVFAGLRGMPQAELLRIAEHLGLRQGIAEAIEALKRTDYEVVLLSSGVPQPVVEQLCRKLGASRGWGIEVELSDDVLTGRVSGKTLDGDGKVRIVEALLREMELRWEDVLAIGDDRSNIALFKLVGMPVGFRSTPSLSRYVQVELRQNELDDFPAVLVLRERHPYLRKLLHLSGVSLIPLHLYSPRVALCALTVLTGTYLISELLRGRGGSLPLITRLTKLCLNRREEGRLALAPVSLAMGVLFTLALFPPSLAYAAILAACVGDVFAMLVGVVAGRIPHPHNRRKTLEGSLAHFASTALACYLVLGVPMVLFSLTAALIETMPLGQSENFVVPVAPSALYHLFSG